MRCPFLKKIKGTECCKYKGDCPLLAHLSGGGDLDCLNLTETEYQSMERRKR